MLFFFLFIFDSLISIDFEAIGHFRMINRKKKEEKKNPVNIFRLGFWCFWIRKSFCQVQITCNLYAAIPFWSLIRVWCFFFLCCWRGVIEHKKSISVFEHFLTGLFGECIAHTIKCLIEIKKKTLPLHNELEKYMEINKQNREVCIQACLVVLRL